MEQILAKVDDALRMREFLWDTTRIDDGSRPFECVYHYTRPNVLNEFIKDGGDFLCSHFRGMNDPYEFLDGLNPEFPRSITIDAA